MIAYLNGKLAYKEATFVIIDVAGIGYEVKISLRTYAHLKNEESCKLHTHLHIKEDAHTLFGFSEIAEKQTFLHLISINGVGPSIAMMILSSLSSEELQHAVLQGEVKTIQKVKGVGAKTAQRIILELADKFEKLNTGIARASGEEVQTKTTLFEEASAALVTLGYNKATAEKTITKILTKFGADISLEELIKQALKSS